MWTSNCKQHSKHKKVETRFLYEYMYMIGCHKNDKGLVSGLKLTKCRLVKMSQLSTEFQLVYLAFLGIPCLQVGLDCS